MSKSLNDKSPKISVIMGVYNGQDCIERAVHSILEQSFTDFELIIIDDGSSDETPRLLKALADKDARIKLIRHDNKGLTKSLNIGVNAARGEYIARQDADDYALTNRFEIQIARFEAEPDLQLLGGNAIDKHCDGNICEWGYFDDETIMKRAQLCTPFPHSTVMMRANALIKLGGYDERFITSQDTELWMRFVKIGRISMTQEALIERGVHKGSISNKRKWRQFRDVLRARLEHYPGSKFYALYFSLRGLILAYMPQCMIEKLKGFLRRGDKRII